MLLRVFSVLGCALFIPGGALFIPRGCLIHPHSALRVGLNWSPGMNRSLYLKWGEMGEDVLFLENRVEKSG